MSIIIYSPPTWQGVMVPDKATADAWVRDRGYRFTQPQIEAQESTIATSDDETIIEDPIAPPDTPIPISSIDDRTNINTAELQALIALPKVGIAKAKQLIAARDKQPIANIDDLYAAVKGVDWGAIEHLIIY